MDLFVLRAVLGLDKSDYEQGINDAKSSAESAGGGIGGALSNAAKVGAAALTAATTAATAFAGSAVQAGMDFDASMSNVAAISGATGDDFLALRDKAQEMGASTKFSATEAADAFSYMAMAGWKTEDMLGGIEGVMSLAAASGEDLATTSDIVTDALTAFGLKAEDSGHFADILAAASSNANTNVSMMGETFKYAAPIAGAMGFSAEDTAEAIGLMANSGIKASQAGTSLRTIMTAMTGPIEIAGEKLGKVTIETTNADGSMRGLSEILTDCRGAFSQLSESEQAAAAESIAGKNAMSGFLALMNAAPEDIEKLSGAIDDCDGAAARMAATMQDNLAGDITIFKSALEGAQIVISDQLTPTLREFVQFGTEAVSTLSTAFKEGGLDGAMSALSTILTDGLNLVIGKLPEMVDAGVQLLGAIGTGIIQNLPALAEAAVQIIGMLGQYLAENIPGLMTTSAEVITQLATMLTDPGTTGTMVDAALGIIQALADGLLESLPVLIESLPTIIENMVQSITENAPKLIETGVAIITALVQGITDNLPTLLEKIPEMISSLLGAILENAPKLLEGAAQIILTLAEGLITSLPTLIAKIPEIIASIVTTIGEHAPDIAGAAGELIGAMLTGFTEAFPALLDGVSQLMGGLVDTIGNALSGALDWGKDMASNFAQGVSDGWNTAKDAVGGFAQGIADWLGFSEPKEGPLSNFHTFAPDMMALFAQGIRENMGEVTTAIAQAFDVSSQMAEIGEKMLNSLTQALNAFGVRMKDVGMQLASMMVDGLTMSQSAVSDAGIKMADLLHWAMLDNMNSSHNMEDVGEFAALSIALGMENTTQSVLDTGIQLMEALASTVTDSGSKMAEAAQSLMMQMSTGIKAGRSVVLLSITSLLNEMDGTVDRFSRQAQDWGQDLMSNFANGIRNGFNQVKSSINEVTAWIRSNLHFSQPDQGPLKDFGTYAPDMMELFAQGVRDNARMLQEEIESAFDFGSSIVAPRPQMSEMASGWGQPEVIVPRQNNERPIEIVVKLQDDTVLGRAIYRLYNDESYRVGTRLITGAR